MFSYHQIQAVAGSRRREPPGMSARAGQIGVTDVRNPPGTRMNQMMPRDTTGTVAERPVRLGTLTVCETCGTAVPVSATDECDCGCGLVCWDPGTCMERWDAHDAADAAATCS
jgi:hypothetical protein